MIILRGVNLFPSQIEEIALEIKELSRTSSCAWPDRARWMR